MLRASKVETLVGDHGKGPRLCIARFRESGIVRRSATGSAGGHVVRSVWRVKSPTHRLTPPKKNRGGPTFHDGGRERRKATAGVAAPIAASLGIGDALGLSGAPSDDVGGNSAQACWGKARVGRGGQLGESLARESWWVSGVLVDNMLVAEIGERHLVSPGSPTSAASKP